MSGKIAVPREMTRIAWEASNDINPGTTDPHEVDEILEAALRWQMENPILPSEDQARYLLFSLALGGDERRGGPINVGQVRAIISSWQRRMFLAPEPEIRPFVNRICEQFQGVTLTPMEAEHIVESIRVEVSK